MTEALYLHSDVLKATATVVSCEPLEDGLWAVQLDKTIFHPQGGGQPSDIGHINGMEVKKVVHTAEGIIHWLMAPVEGSVQLTVNAALRSLNTRLHSAGHIIGLVGDRRGWHATRGNHFPGEARVIFEPNDPSTIVLPDPLTFENEVNGILAQGLCRKTAEDHGLRTVTWGDLEPYPCGGTHVLNTCDIGTVHISKIKLKKGQISVSYSVD